MFPLPSSGNGCVSSVESAASEYTLTVGAQPRVDVGFITAPPLVPAVAFPCVSANCSCVVLTEVRVKLPLKNVSVEENPIMRTSRPLIKPAVSGLDDMVSVATLPVTLAAVVVNPVPEQTLASPETAVRPPAASGFITGVSYRAD